MEKVCANCKHSCRDNYFPKTMYCMHNDIFKRVGKNSTCKNFSSYETYIKKEENKKMARKKNVVEATLDTLIPAYAENKAMLDDYKKICDSENKQIKELMEEGSYEVAGWKATKSIQRRDIMNEDKLLDVLKQYPTACYEQGLIKTKEYVDMDVLESMIYKGVIDKDMLLEIDKCREPKEVITLRISKVKEG